MATELLLRIDEFEHSKDEALIAWLDARWRSERGGGARAKVGKLSLDLGRSGAWRWKTLGVSIGLWIASSEAVIAFSAGASHIPWWSAPLIMPVYASILPAMEGGSASWKTARKQGSGLIGAFSALCKRYGLNIASMAAPTSAVDLPRIALGLSYLMVDRAQWGLAKAGAAKTSVALTPALDKLDQGIERLNAMERQMSGWKAGLLVKAAHFDGASAFQAEDIYANLAKLRMLSRWRLLTQLEKALELNPEELGERVGPILGRHAPELALRASAERLVQKASLDAKSLPYLLDRIEAAGVPAWFQPEPGMPTLGDIARSVGRDYAAEHGDGSRERVAALSAEEEARQIGGAVGELALANPLSAPAKKNRL